MLPALVQGSAQRLAPLTHALPERQSLPGWLLWMLESNHLPASEKRLGPLCGLRSAALPGHTLADGNTLWTFTSAVFDA